MANTSTVIVLEEAAAANPAVMSLRRYLGLVGWGLLVTTLGQMVSLGNYPIRFLLKKNLGLSATEMATFISLAILPWSFKPIAGLLADTFPIFGSRRKYYLILFGFAAGLLWLAMGIVPRTFHCLLITAVAFNVAAVFVSTVTGGLLVEGGQKYGRTGLISSIRLVAINIAAIGASFVGGWLATVWFGWTTIIAASLFLSMVPATFLLLREEPLPQTSDPLHHPLHAAWVQLKSVLSAKTLWICGGLFFLVQVSPGLSTPLFYYQTNVLKFTPQFLGELGVISGVMGFAGSAIYPLMCSRFRLRPLLAFSIVITVASNMAYLGYISRPSAMFIEGFAGLGVTLAQLPLFDLAARATPKGSEALAYSLMLSFWNIGLSLSDVIGSWLFDHFHQTFMRLVWVNAGTTAAVLLVIPFLPGKLVDRKEGEGTHPSPE